MHNPHVHAVVLPQAADPDDKALKSTAASPNTWKPQHYIITLAAFTLPLWPPGDGTYAVAGFGATLDWVSIGMGMRLTRRSSKFGRSRAKQSSSSLVRYSLRLWGPCMLGFRG